MTDIKALFFDMDGVIIDTERDGHRVAFNQAFKQFGYDFSWDEQRYHQLLQVAGGKERMRHYFREEGFLSELSDEEMSRHLIELHKCKTSIFLDMIAAGKLPLRPGIKRFMSEAMERGLDICLCTTSAEKSARTVVETLLPEIDFTHILAGDIVTKKKPDPAIYNLALQKTGYSPEACIVIEDSAIGVQAAKAAGIRVIATTNGYTEDEDLSAADIIVTTLGDEGGERGILKSPAGKLDFGGVLYLDQVIEWFSSPK
ncbi:MAG: HAD-IA family hydrolase [Desulfofustis sp.]